MRRCEFENTAVEAAVELVGDAAIIDACTLVAGGTETITAAAAQDAVIMHCKLNKDIDTDITNLIENGYNIVDANITL